MKQNESWEAIISFEQTRASSIQNDEPYALHRIEVPGGWIYVIYEGLIGGGRHLSSCYVPIGD